MDSNIEEIAKKRGFFWPSQEIYGGISGFYDYGPLGTLMKRKIEQIIFNHYVNIEGCLSFEAPVLTTLKPWEISGHIDNFSDSTIDCNDCGKSFKEDNLEQDSKCDKCGGSDFSNPYSTNLMFKTEIGTGKSKTEGALRPETAQTTYMSFKRLFEMARKKLPFGVIQIGKSFRNEISPRKAIIRMREFSQAEIQFFVTPEFESNHKISDIEIDVLRKEDQPEGSIVRMKMNEVSGICGNMVAHLLESSIMLYKKIGIDLSKLRLRQHMDDERSFYSSDTWDIEFVSDKYGIVELVGVAKRTDYDLKKHQESGESMEVTFEEKKIIPNVIEVAYGLDRPLLCIMESCIKQEDDRVFFTFPLEISPYQVAIFPLVKKDGLPEKAKEIFNNLKKDFQCLYDQSGSIGKMYYRQDEAGTPFCITIDYETEKDDSVTIRIRDNQKQERVKISDLKSYIESSFK